MTREWKPGDVAMGSAGEGRMFWTARGWVFDDGDQGIRSVDYEVRPLVVIDPEDREQVERLTGTLVLSGAGKNDDNHWREVRAALREFANPTPPKPDEPTGLGAVVEDSNGDRWIRGEARIADFNWIGAADASRSRAYRNINAVRVLSEGVTS